MGSFCSLSEPRIHNIVRLGLKLMRIRREWAHGDLNPGSSPCKGDVITELDYEPKAKDCQNPFKS